MAKSVHNDVLDAALNVIKNSVTRQTVCATQPATFAEATSTKRLAEVTMAPADFTVAAGDVSGRKVAVAAKSGVAVTVTGTADHLALVDVAGSRLLLVTTCTAQALTAGNTVNIPTWDDEIAAPT